ncbi:MAG: hypothetical protein OCD00_02020 [Colwellia sp.]
MNHTMQGWKTKFIGTKVGFALAAGLTGSVAQATDHSTAITAAGTDGQTNVEAAVVVILTLAAVVTGVGIVYKLLTSK